MRNDEKYNPKPKSSQLCIAGLGEDGERDANAAREWIGKHPEDYDYMVENARRLYRKHGYVSANYLVNMVRNERLVGVKNGLAPSFARIMEDENEDLGGAFTMHESRCDGYAGDGLG